MAGNVSDCIIVVDDVVAVTMVLQEQLAAAGFENIVTYNNPLKALSAILAATRPAIVITDYDMPTMTGIELLAEIGRGHPDINGVIITGDTAAAQEGGCPYRILAKGQYTHDELIGHVMNAIRSHLRPILNACPFGNQQPNCPLSAIRLLSADEKEAWLQRALPRELQRVIAHHHACLSR